MSDQFLAGFGIGLAVGAGLRNVWLALRKTAAKRFGYLLSDKPLRLRQTFAGPVVAVVEPPHRLGQWMTYTHAYILRGEMCKRGPCNRREMEELTGLSWRQQAKYMDVLRQGRVVQVDGGKVAWLGPKLYRRRRLYRLPYPTDFDPPPF